MRLVTFASGSGGNCALIRGRETNLLMDAGISMRRIRAALARQALTMGDVDGVLITHEHSDHVYALKTMLKTGPRPIYAPRTVAYHLVNALPELEAYLRVVPVGAPFALREFTLTAFATPHDTDESVGYRIEGADGRLGFCTDTGSVTEDMLSALCGCDAALIEANHDVDMLRYGPYPAALKRRILSDRGHLSNDDCADFACALAKSGVGGIVLGHLSKENNTPRKAFETVREALDGEGFGGVELAVAPRDEDMLLEVTPCCASN